MNQVSRDGTASVTVLVHAYDGHCAPMSGVVNAASLVDECDEDVDCSVGAECVAHSNVALTPSPALVRTQWV